MDSNGATEGIAQMRGVTARAEAAGARSAAHAELKLRALELERANAELESFSRVIAHDLAEGLGTIELFASTLEAHLGEAPGPAAERDLDRIHSGVQHMRSLIDAARESAGASADAHTSVDANLVVDDAISNVEARIVRTRASIVPEPLPWVLADAAQLTRLFQNLLSNSLKFRHPSRPPRIRIGATRRSRRWLFTLADNGLGLGPELAERAFGERAPAPEDELLGLAICRGIVTEHGGSIRADLRPHGGTTVSFDLPAAAPPRLATTRP